MLPAVRAKSVENARAANLQCSLSLSSLVCKTVAWSQTNSRRMSDQWQALWTATTAGDYNPPPYTICVYVFCTLKRDMLCTFVIFGLLYLPHGDFWFRDFCRDTVVYGGVSFRLRGRAGWFYAVVFYSFAVCVAILITQTGSACEGRVTTSQRFVLRLYFFLCTAPFYKRISWWTEIALPFHFYIWKRRRAFFDVCVLAVYTADLLLAYLTLISALFWLTTRLNSLYIVIMIGGGL